LVASSFGAPAAGRPSRPGCPRPSGRQGGRWSGQLAPVVRWWLGRSPATRQRLDTCLRFILEM